jgi:hypothetical protein
VKHKRISVEISSKQVNEGSYNRKASEQSIHYGARSLLAGYGPVNPVEGAGLRQND